MATERTEELLELAVHALRKMEEQSGSELEEFNFAPKYIRGRLTKVTVVFKFDPMVEE